MHNLYAFWAYYTQYLCWFCTYKPLFFSHYTMPCADLSKRQACVRTSLMRVLELDCDLQVNKKKKKEAGISTRAFPLESPGKNVFSKRLFHYHWGLRSYICIVSSVLFECWYKQVANRNFFVSFSVPKMPFVSYTNHGPESNERDIDYNILYCTIYCFAQYYSPGAKSGHSLFVL